MIINYENTRFKVRITSSIERMLIKQRIKQLIGRFINKPYHQDEYVRFATEILSSKSSGIVVDVGCNIGSTVIPLAKKFPHISFFAIEPHPIPSSRFIQNCELNDLQNVTLVSCAIANTPSFAQIHTCPNNSGGHRLMSFSHRTDLAKYSVFSNLNVPTHTLREIFEHFGITHCELLKVDTEGYETQVLQSLGDFLHPNHVKNIVTELGYEGLEDANSSAVELLHLTQEHSYSCKLLQTLVNISKPSDMPQLKRFEVKDLIFQ